MSDAVQTQSDDIALLVVDLLAAQQAFPSIEKDAVNPHFGSAFSSLKAVVRATRPILNEHNLVISQWPVRGGLKTRLLHASGQWIAEEMDLCGQQTPQGQGSGLTYAKRYAWKAILGLDDEEGDDDGTAAQQNFHGGSGKQTEHGQPPSASGRNSTQNAADTAPAPRGSQSRNNDGPPEPSPGCSIRLGGKKDITEGQGRALYAISQDKKFNLSTFIAMHTNGKREDELTSWEASQLIDGVNAGRLSTEVPTAGAEAVAEAFPGAEVVKPVGAGYGFDEQPF